jgi:hypothetical protein
VPRIIINTYHIDLTQTSFVLILLKEVSLGNVVLPQLPVHHLFVNIKHIVRSVLCIWGAIGKEPVVRFEEFSHSQRRILGILRRNATTLGRLLYFHRVLGEKTDSLFDTVRFRNPG